MNAEEYLKTKKKYRIEKLDANNKSIVFIGSWNNRSEAEASAAKWAKQFPGHVYEVLELLGAAFCEKAPSVYASKADVKNEDDEDEDLF